MTMDPTSGLDAVLADLQAQVTALAEQLAADRAPQELPAHEHPVESADPDVFLDAYEGYDSQTPAVAVAALQAALDDAAQAGGAVLVSPLAGRASYAWHGAGIVLRDGIRLISTTGRPASEFDSDDQVKVKLGTGALFVWPSSLPASGEVSYLYLEGLLFVGAGLGKGTVIATPPPGGMLADLEVRGCAAKNLAAVYRGPMLRCRALELTYVQNLGEQPALTVRGADNGSTFIAGYQGRGRYQVEYADLEFTNLSREHAYFTPTPGGGLRITGRCDGLVTPHIIVNGLSKQAGRKASGLEGRGAPLLYAHTLYTDLATGVVWWSTGTEWVVHDDGVARTFQGRGDAPANLPVLDATSAPVARLYEDTSKGRAPLRWWRWGGAPWPYWTGPHFGIDGGSRVYGDGNSAAAVLLENGEGNVFIPHLSLRFSGLHPYTDELGVDRRGALQVRNWRDGTVTIGHLDVSDHARPALTTAGRKRMLAEPGANPLGLVHVHVEAASVRVLSGGLDGGPLVTATTAGGSLVLPG